MQHCFLIIEIAILLSSIHMNSTAFHSSEHEYIYTTTGRWLAFVNNMINCTQELISDSQRPALLSKDANID